MKVKLALATLMLLVLTTFSSIAEPLQPLENEFEVELEPSVTVKIKVIMMDTDLDGHYDYGILTQNGELTNEWDFNPPNISKSSYDSEVQNQTANSKTVKIVPNPATNQINLHINTSIPEKCTAYIYDAEGRLKTTWEIPANSQSSELFFDLKDFTAGTYFIRINSTVFTLNEKFVIVK